jgi:hypothetical protein
MRHFNTLIVTSLALVGLAFAGCEKKATTTTTTETTTTAPATTPPPAATAPAPVETTPAPAEPDRKPVSGSEPIATTPPASSEPTPATPPARSEPTAATPPATEASGGDVFWISDGGKRAMLHDSGLITQVQQKLSKAGIYKGATDGRSSEELATAISNFQFRKGLPKTGAIDRYTAEAMGLEWAKFQGGDTKPTSDILTDVEKKASAVESDVEKGLKEGASDVEKEANKAANEVEDTAKEAGKKVDEQVK